MPEETVQPVIKNPAPILMSPMTVRQLGLSMIPFTPVPFTGDKALFAYIRIGVYGLLSYWMWGKMRQVSYAMMGATAVSFATSLSAGVWYKELENSLKEKVSEPVTVTTQE